MLASSSRWRSLAALAGAVALASLATAPSPAGAADAPRAAGAAPMGINLTDWTPDGYAQAGPALAAARRDGITSVTLVPTLYVDDVRDSSVAPQPGKTPTDASVRRAAADAIALGMTVTVKPHVDVLDGSFRGHLAPSDPDAWFASYDGWLGHYARLAQAAGADTLVIGTELDSLLDDEAGFDQLIATARQDFSGRLTYAANWDTVEDVGFWDRLDVIGVDAYVPLGDASSTPAQLTAAWTPFLRRLGRLHESTGKPVAFTELGYQSRRDALTTPFNATGPSDPAVQARGYRAALEVWSAVPWFAGISWWNWHARSGEAAPGDGGFSPQGKPAEAVLRAWNARHDPGSVAAEAGGSGRSAVGGVVLVLALVLVLAVAVAVGVRRRRGRSAPRDPQPVPVPVPAADAPEPAPDHAPAPAPDRAAEPAPDPVPARTVAAITVDPAVETVLSVARLTLDSVTAVLFLRDAHDPRLAHVVAGIGVGDDLVGRVLASDEGLMGHVLMTGNAIAVADCNELPAPIRHPFTDGVVAALSVPVVLHGRTIGALTVGRTEQYAPSERHLLRPLVNEIAQLVAPSLSARDGRFSTRTPARPS
jgi:hypothetical protein